VTSSWQELRQAFLERYHRSNMKWYDIDSVLNVRLSPGESIETFTDQFRRKCKEYDLSEDIIMSRYMAALPTSLQTLVMQGMPDTFDKMIRLAYNGVKVIKTTDSNRTVTFSDNNNLRSEVQVLRSQVDRITRYNQDRDPNISRNNYNARITSYNTVSRGNNNNNSLKCWNCDGNHKMVHCPSLRQRTIQCYRCGGPNHMANECYRNRTSEPNWRERPARYVQGNNRQQ